MAQLIEKIKDFFTAPPCPSLVFQFSSSYISAIQVEVKEKKVKRHAILPLPAGLIEPHFDRRNLPEAAALAGLMKEGLGGLHFSGEKAACLIPESCFKIFILPFETFPPSGREREKLLLWRIKKHLPVLPEDARLSFEEIASGASLKVFLSLARIAVIQEYEELCTGLGLDVGILTAPTLSLLNLVDQAQEKDLILANIEEDSISLAAVTPSDIMLYRVKPFIIERRGRIPTGQRVETVIKEIENTVHFIEDREKRKIQSLWLHSSLTDHQEVLFSELAARLPFPIKLIDSPCLGEIPPSEKAFLVPLAGQIP